MPTPRKRPKPGAARICECGRPILPLGTKRHRCLDCATTREHERLLQKWARQNTRKAIRRHGYLRHQIHPPRRLPAALLGARPSPYSVSGVLVLHFQAQNQSMSIEGGPFRENGPLNRSALSRV